MTMKLSPLAPKFFPSLPTVAGVRFATGEAGVKYQGRTDVMVAELAQGTTVAGVFTKSLCPSAPVDWCREVLPEGKARVLVVNSGNANAFTGREGVNSVERTAKAASKVFKCAESEVYLASTGVIGEKLPDGVITDALPALKKELDGNSWQSAAEAIMTTDTFPKGASVKTKIGDAEVNICGFVKGSGMIAPNMGTMLAFLFTDANLPASVLQKLLAKANDKTFNCVTVDSDTSTSDTALLFATGLAGNHKVSKAKDPRLKGFKKALKTLMTDLAQQLAKDGEGAEKFITINVTGAATEKAARTIALSIGNSPLVKTAVAGEDANWGRIVMAVGKAGEKANRDKIAIKIGGVAVSEFGEAVEGYDETPVAAHMKGRDISIEVDVGVGKSKATVWTCDLTHRYIDINADYRT
ncbi:MAG: bifunctional glutamate N-acetyltransferase/amino-acid acetyltransferase ArgJ [Rhodospirillales bacterium]|nr:bifunctional glutamate N-acetyltransferase/amino-acid acetyltransferase ArgJ [Rhodospirillales bacterium]